MFFFSGATFIDLFKKAGSRQTFYKMQTVQLYVSTGDICGIMVTVVGNGLGDLSSNSGRSVWISQSANIFGKSLNRINQALGKCQNYSLSNNSILHKHTFWFYLTHR